jgi:hypothetical protein
MQLIVEQLGAVGLRPMLWQEQRLGLGMVEFQQVFRRLL